MSNYHKFYFFGILSGLLLCAGVILIIQPSTPPKTQLEEDWLRNAWTTDTVKRTIQIYFYNWTNTDGFQSFDQKNFAEVGPIVFDVDEYWSNITWEVDKFSYKLTNHWKTNTELSKINLTSHIIHPNEILAIAINENQNVTDFKTRRVFDYLLEKKEFLTLNHTVEQILFNGYVDKVLPRTSDLRIPVLNFRYFYNSSGLWTRDWLGNFLSYNYSGDAKSLIKLSDELNGHHSEYVGSLCGIMTWKSREAVNYNGISAINLTGSDYLPTFHKYSDNPPLECYSRIFPISIAQSHLERQLERNYMVVEPYTGLPLEFNISQTIDVLFQKLPWSDSPLRNLSGVKLPVLRYKETFKRSPSSVEEILRSMNHNTPQFFGYALLISGACGCLVVLVVLFQLAVLQARSSLSESLLRNEES